MLKVINVSACKNDSGDKIPLYLSRPSAGFSIPGDDSIDTHLNINDFLIDNPSATFFVKVAGDSMEGAKIFSGDILVVDRSVSPVSGKDCSGRGVWRDGGKAFAYKYQRHIFSFRE
jgi:DNA polymerase V